MQCLVRFRLELFPFCFCFIPISLYSSVSAPACFYKSFVWRTHPSFTFLQTFDVNLSYRHNSHTSERIFFPFYTEHVNVFLFFTFKFFFSKGRIWNVILSNYLWNKIIWAIFIIYPMVTLKYQTWFLNWQSRLYRSHAINAYCVARTSNRFAIVNHTSMCIV